MGSCIIADQFVRQKRGDRYWYETSDRHLRFTPGTSRERRDAPTPCDRVLSLLLSLSLSLFRRLAGAEQLKEIRKTTLARLLCQNGDAMDAIQPRAMESVGPSNAKTPCWKITPLNLKLWRD